MRYRIWPQNMTARKERYFQCKNKTLCVWKMWPRNWGFPSLMLFVLTECNQEQVYSEGKRIYICCHEPDDQEKVWKLFESWWRKQAKAILQKRAEHWYPIIEKYGVAMPKVTVRKMKTLWGSCSVNRGAITFNFYLIKARMPYIDYVILHELTHFLYPNHSKQFYMFLSNYMPDWKERKHILDQEVVHGL